MEYSLILNEIQSLNMNNNFMLQNFIENGNGSNPGENRGKKASKVGGGHELELLVGTIFNQVCQLFEENSVKISVPEQVTKITEKANLLKSFIEQLIHLPTSDAQKINQSGIISCKDCQHYEQNLQKLEGQVRGHIRLQQQLKIYQDSLDQKLDEFKKEKRQFEKRLESSKKQIEELKNMNSSLNEKMGRLEGQVDSLKKQNRDLKRSATGNQQGMTTKRQSHKPSSYAYESKQNKIDWVHRNISIKKDEKEKQYERKSVEKRTDSGEKGWRQSNTKSNKMISVLNDKLIHEKTKEERKKAIQSKLEYRR